VADCLGIVGFSDDRGTSLLKGKGDAQRELAAKLQKLLDDAWRPWW
jgi:hypothetical protein